MARAVAKKAYAIAPDEYYKIVRSEIQHEDDLINHRLTWLVYLQTIFFGGFFLLGSSTSVSLEHWTKARSFIVAIGLASSVAALAGIFLAARAIRALRWRFLDQLAAHKADAQEYPDPVVSSFSNLLGLTIANAIPLVLLLGWIYLATIDFRPLATAGRNASESGSVTVRAPTGKSEGTVGGQKEPPKLGNPGSDGESKK